MNYVIRVTIFLGVSVLLFSSVVEYSYADAKSFALLKGVEKERMKLKTYSITLRTRYVDDQFPSYLSRDISLDECVYVDHEKRLHERLPPEDEKILKVFKGNITVRGEDGDVYDYAVGRTDVTLCDRQIAARRGIIFHHPSVIGLTASTDIRSDDVGSCLSPSDAQKNGVAAFEELDGRKLWHVHYFNEQYKEITYDVWVEDSTFRVYRSVAKGPHQQTTIDAKYEGDKMGAIPSWVHLVRVVKGERVFDRTTTVLNFEAKTFPPEVFTIKSLKLPINTSVTDYRINKIIGYWDGEKLQQLPVNNNAPTEIRPVAESYLSRIFFIVLGLAFIIVWFILVSQKKKNH
jgi:hypothetical protein